MLPIHREKNIILHSPHDEKAFGLDAYFLANHQPKPVVIFIHGFNGFKDWGHFNLVAEYFAASGFTFITFNLSHNGTTIERPTEFVDLHAYGNDFFSTDLDDIGVVIDFLFSDQCPFSLELDLSNLSLIGHSRGGALAILKAGEDKRIRSIATWASIKSTLHFWIPLHVEEVERNGVVYVKNGRTQQKLPLYKSYYEDAIFNQDRLNVADKIKQLDIPILLAHGDADTSIPVQFAHDLQSWQPRAEKFIVSDANHTFGGKHPYDSDQLPEATQILAEKTVDFFQKTFQA